MKFTASFLRSKVARRILFLFILCALLPISVLAVISFFEVTSELNDQSQRRLFQASKAGAMSIYERLEFLEGELNMRAAHLDADSSAALHAAPERLVEDRGPRFESLALFTREGRLKKPLIGLPQRVPGLTEGQLQHLLAGKAVLVSQQDSSAPARVWMIRALDPQHFERGFLAGEIHAEALWSADTIPEVNELCVFDESNRALFCSSPMPASVQQELARQIGRSPHGQFRWSREREKLHAGYWSVFLKPRFYMPRWTIVLSESDAEILAPLTHFKTIFPLVIVLSLWVVLLLSMIQIRRSLVPLEKLREGTRRIADRDFSTRVTVTSGDEFQELAASFNTMAGRLGTQFKVMTTIHELDRAILASLDTHKIVDTLLLRMRDILPYAGVSVTLLDPNEPSRAFIYTAPFETGCGKQVQPVQLTDAELDDLRRNPEALLLNGQRDLPGYLAPLARRGMSFFLILPLFVNDVLSGIISLGHPVPAAHSAEDRLHARQVANQVAIALSNAHLMEKLDQLNWGTLTALARAIDAKSQWTAGHSERVTGMAVKIGRQVGLPPKELEVLVRGGLLHDIGKIGTPAAILNKPGKLDDAEYSQMKDHVRTGVRILEPIPGFKEILPIVLEHHERWDGSGYPDGKAGEAISLHARIFAVADVYDALISDRPYRPGWEPARVVQFIREKAGSQFDPKVADAFLQVMDEEKKTEAKKEAVREAREVVAAAP